MRRRISPVLPGGDGPLSIICRDPVLVKIHRTAGGVGARGGDAVPPDASPCHRPGRLFIQFLFPDTLLARAQSREPQNDDENLEGENKPQVSWSSSDGGGVCSAGDSPVEPASLIPVAASSTHPAARAVLFNERHFPFWKRTG